MAITINRATARTALGGGCLCRTFAIPKIDKKQAARVAGGGNPKEAT